MQDKIYIYQKFELLNIKYFALLNTKYFPNKCSKYLHKTIKNTIVN